VLGSHIWEGPPGTFSSVHRHGPSAHVLWLKGEGYSILWPDGGEDSKLKEEWLFFDSASLLTQLSAK